MADDKTFMIEDAKLLFLNFKGEPSQFNAAGDRNFCVLIDPGVAPQMEKDGWNVKILRSRDEDEPDQFYVQVKVAFKHKPPRVWMLSSTGRTPLNEETIEILDYADIETVDLIARAYEWDVQGKSGLKAYLQSMFVTIREDALERKYGLTMGGGDEG